MDPIKEYYESIKSAGYFVDEADFRSQLSQSPKDVFQTMTDIFVDFDDFETSLGLKKKDGGAAQKQSIPQLQSSSKNILAQRPSELPLGVPKTNLSVAEQSELAKLRVDDAINTSDDILKRMVRESKLNQFESEQQNIPQFSGAKNPAIETAKRAILTNIPISQEEVMSKKSEAMTDVNTQREVIKRTKSPELAKDLYLIDASQRVDTPEREAKILQNADKIASGELQYDVKKGIIQKPIGAIESTIKGFSERGKQMDDYDFMSNADDQTLINKLETDRTSVDYDEPVKTPSGAIAQFGEMLGMEGIPMVKSATAAVVTGAIPGAQAAAPYVAAFAASPEYYQRSYATGLRNAYYELRDQGKTPEEALATARDQAMKEGVIGAAEGAVSSAIGSRIGFKPTTVTVTPGFKGAVKTAINATKNFVVENAPEAATDAASAGLLQIASNITARDNGLKRDLFEGVQSTIADEWSFTLGVVSLTKAGRALINADTYKTILNGVSRQPKEAVDAKIGEMVVDGVMTPEEAVEVGAEIDKQRIFDSQIPDSVPESIRADVAEMVEKRDGLKKQLQTTNEAFHPAIKKDIEATDKQIVAMSGISDQIAALEERRLAEQQAINAEREALPEDQRDKTAGDRIARRVEVDERYDNEIQKLKDATKESAITEGPAGGDIIQPQGAVQGQPEVGQGAGQQGDATQPKADVGDSNLGSKVAPGKKLFNDPNPEAARVEEEFKKTKGINTPEPAPITKLDENKSKTIADAYDQLVDTPDDPEVQQAYQSMADETMEQYDAIAKSGVNVEMWTGQGEPYKNSGEMIADVRDNKHMYIFSTEEGFGDTPITDQQRQQNALLRDSGIKDVNGKPMLINDIFRFVHDYFGHTRLGNSFGAIGEENAWNVHARMYSPLARRAMTTETRGQNSWVNFNKSMRNPDGTMKKKGDEGYIPPAQRPFAEQKMALLPEEFSQIEDAYSVQPEAVQPAAQAPTMAEELQQFMAESPMDEAIAMAEESLTKSNIKFKTIDDPNAPQGLFVSDTGEITINRAKLADDIEAGIVVWHEASHPVMNIIRNTDKPLYDAVVRGLQDAAKNNSSIDDALAWAQSQPEYDNVDTQNDEAIVETIGRINAGLIDINSLDTGFKQKLIDFINEIAKFFGIDPIINDTDIAQFKKTVSEVANALKTGRDIAEIVGEQNVFDYGLNLGSSTQLSVGNAKGTRVTFNASYPLSFVKPKDKINIMDLVRDIESKGQKVWFWVADQLGRGMYYDKVVDGEHYLDAGPSFALDPKNRSKNVIWATGKGEKWVNDNIAKSDYIFIISGSPTKSKLFNKRVSELTFNRVKKSVGEEGAWDKFKSEMLAVSKIGNINEILNKYNSFEELLESPDRKQLLIAIDSQKDKKGTPLKGLLEKYDAFVDYNDLRDGFYKDNDFQLNDIMLVLKPTGYGGKSEHSTYENDILGEVVGVPDMKVNAFDIMPEDFKAKYKPEMGRTEQSQAVAPYGSGIRNVQASAGNRLAPNGQPSKLNAKQYEQVRTPEFKNWFGDWENDPANASKVVDENGEPLVVYHGSRSTVDFAFSEFNVPPEGVFFSSDLKTASWFSDGASPKLIFEEIKKPETLTENSSLQELEKYYQEFLDPSAQIEETKMSDGSVYLRFNTDYDSSSSPLGEDVKEAQKKLYKQVVNAINYANNSDKRPFYEAFLNMREPFSINAKGKTFDKTPYKGKEYSAVSVSSDIKAKGKNDGVIIKNTIETTEYNRKSDSYIVFDPNQIKSATENVGTFSTQDNRIQFSAGNRLAPNGKPSKLTKTQYQQVRTPEFKAWFGDWETNPESASKALDENGEPLVLFHGTKAKFDQFEYNKMSWESRLSQQGPGFYMTDNKKAASQYGKPMNVFTSVKNPLVIDNKSSSITKEQAYQLFSNGDNNWFYNSYLPFYTKSEGLSKKELIKKYVDDMSGVRGFDKEVLQNIKRSYNQETSYDNMMSDVAGILGKDGVIEKVSDGLSVYVAFTPNQIKSATENVGTFSTEDDRIQFSAANRPEFSKDFKLGAFVMRKKAEGASDAEIAGAVASVTQMSKEEIDKLISDPEQYIRDSFPSFSKQRQDNLIERAKMQNIYRGRQFGKPIDKKFVGLEIPRNLVDQYMAQNGRKDNVAKKIYTDFKKKWLDPAKGLPDWVLAIKDFSKGTKNIEIARAAKTIERLKAEAKRIGFQDWDAFSKAMVAANNVQRFIPDEDGIVPFDPYRAYEGRTFTAQDDQLPSLVPDEIKALPEEIIPYVYAMRGQIDRLTKDLIGSGYVTPDQAVTLERNIGQYVNRAYRLFNERGYKPEPEVLNAAVNYLANERFQGLLTDYFKTQQGISPDRVLTAEEQDKFNQDYQDFVNKIEDAEKVRLLEEALRLAQADVNAILEKKTNPYFGLSEDKRDVGILQNRKDISDPIRKLMGEYTDPGTTFMMTVAKQAALKGASEYLTKLREFGMGTLFFEAKDPSRPASHSVPLASIGTESMSPLGGLVTTKEIYDAIQSIEPTYNAMTQAWMKLVGYVRWGKTVGSVATQFKNFESNLGFAVLNGLLYTGQGTEPFKGAWQYVKGQYGKEEIDALTEKLIKLNLVGQSVGARELKEMLGGGDLHDIALDIALSPEGKWGKKVAKRYNVFKEANKFYRLGDDFWKAYAYLNERQVVARGRFEAPYESLTKEQQEQVDLESSERVKNTWPTYDRVVEGAKVISKNIPIFGNFISFQAESLRVLNNSIKLAKKDLSDPQMKSAGMKRMAGIVSYFMLRSAITIGAAKVAGMAASGLIGAAMGDDDEERRKNAIKQAAPIFMRSGDLAVKQGDQPHKFTIVDMSSLDPYGIIPRSLNAFTDGREGIFGAQMEPGVMAAGTELFSAFLEPEMTFSTMWSARNNTDPKNKQKMVLENDTDIQAAAKVAGAIWDQLEPSTIALIKRMFTTERPAAEFLAIAGARPYEIDLHKSFSIIMSRAGEDLSAINTEYNKIKYNEKATPEEKASAEKIAEDKKAFAISKLNQIYRDFILTGADPNELNAIINQKSAIKVTGFDATTKKSIKTGNINREKLFK